MLTSLHPPVFPWGLLDCANKPPPSPLLGASQRFCSLGLLGRTQHRPHRPPCDRQHHLHVSRRLPEHGKVRGLKAQSHVSANPSRIGTKYKYVHSALQYYYGSATPAQTTEHCAEKQIAKNLTAELFYSRLTAMQSPSRLRVSFSVAVICQYNCLKTSSNACSIS